jgi:hypothetical protein
MPQKSQKWDIKVWCMACSVTKFVWNFAVYCEKKEGDVQDGIQVARGEARLAHGVVIIDLAEDVHGKGHVIGSEANLCNKYSDDK